MFDALLSKRCYKEAWPLDETLEKIRSLSGSHFDPHLVNVFDELLPVLLDIQRTHSDIAVPNSELVEAGYLG